MNQDSKDFETAGFRFIPALLDASEVAHYRTLVQETLGKGDRDFARSRAALGGWGLADGVTQHSEFWPLIFHPKLLSEVRRVLGPDIKYTQHSDLHAHHGTIGFHRDCADRRFGVGRDWDPRLGPYRVLRVAIYLQSFAESGFRIGVIPGSHEYESPWTRMELQLWSRLLTGVTGGVPHLVSAKARWFPTEPGDCLIFSQRLLHCGGPIRGPKYSIFLSYGVDDVHSRDHIEYYLTRRGDLNYRPPPENLRGHLAGEHLLLEPQAGSSIAPAQDVNRMALRE